MHKLRRAPVMKYKKLSYRRQTARRV